MPRHLQRNQSGLSENALSHSMSQTLLAPSLPRLSLLPQRSHVPAVLGCSRASRKLLPSTCEPPWSFLLFYTSPVHYRFLSCWKKEIAQI